MPFTVSHTAIVLPLKQLFPRWFSLSGLMAGAMAPDLLYFLMMRTESRGISHSWLGLFVFCVPAGMLFAYCFHRFFKQYAIYNLPHPFDTRLSGLAEQRFQLSDFNSWMKLAVSVLIGALSHFFWDSLTHSIGEMAQMFPILTESFTILGISRPLCRFLQHASTIIGALVLLVYVLKGYLLPPPIVSRSVRSPGQKFLFWLVGGIVATLFACLVVFCFSIVYDFSLGDSQNSHFIRTSFGLAGWAGLYYYICIYTVAMRYRQKQATNALQDHKPE